MERDQQKGSKRNVDQGTDYGTAGAMLSISVILVLMGFFVLCYQFDGPKGMWQLRMIAVNAIFGAAVILGMWAIGKTPLWVWIENRIERTVGVSRRNEEPGIDDTRDLRE